MARRYQRAEAARVSVMTAVSPTLQTIAQQHRSPLNWTTKCVVAVCLWVLCPRYSHKKVCLCVAALPPPPCPAFAARRVTPAAHRVLLPFMVPPPVMVLLVLKQQPWGVQVRMQGEGWDVFCAAQSPRWPVPLW